jgi:hypothetical protein
VDVSTNFPGLNNTGGPGAGGPVGAYFLNTTNYLNGIHSLYWVASDDHANADGIGSRYFTISNMGGSPIAPDPGVTAAVDESGRLRIGLVQEQEKTGAEGAAEAADPETANWAKLRPAQIKPRTGENSPLTVEVEELGLVELRFQAKGATGKTGAGDLRFIGWGREESRALPIGSTIDPTTGIFSWMPGPGFLGAHFLIFAVTYV